MKIVTWNCNGALRKKTQELDTLDADVYVVQECEDPAQSSDALRDWAGSYLWVGTSNHKGLGVFPKKGNTVRVTESPRTLLRNWVSYEAQGKESTPTFFLQRNESKAYHIDYVFASDDLSSQARVEIGDPSTWLNFSDHMPVSLTISNKL